MQNLFKPDILAFAPPAALLPENGHKLYLTEGRPKRKMNTMHFLQFVPGEEANTKVLQKKRSTKLSKDKKDNDGCSTRERV